MSEVVLAEGLYVKRSKGNMGIGGTARECVMESLWFPLRAENGFVELFPVMDNLKSLLRLIEKIPVELFQEEYSVKDDSREIYLELKKMI